MKSHNRTWLKAAAATVGAGALAFGGAVLPAAADESPYNEATTLVAGDAQGAIAAKAEVTKYDLAQQVSSASAKTLEKNDEDSVRVTSTGQVLHIDPATPAGSPAPAAADADAASVPGTPEKGSRPGAPVTLYLDFDGETLEGTQWNDYYNDSEAFDLRAAGKGSDAAYVKEVWSGVAEDYAPFNINVTTTRPSDDKLYKSSDSDNEYGVHVIITDSYEDQPIEDALTASGLSWLDAVGSEYLQGSLVFTTGASTDGTPSGAAARSVADTASHEAGHAFALEHDGIDGSPAGEYYYPREGVWGPIMGATYDVGLSQWSNGDYAGATNPQDDLATISDRGSANTRLVKLETKDGEYYEGGYCTNAADPDNPKPGDLFVGVDDAGNCDESQPLEPTFAHVDRADYAADDAGNSIEDAAELDNSKTSFSTEGVIERTKDVDVYTLTTIGGQLEASVEVADLGANLDTKLVLSDSEGNVLKQDAPASTAPEVGTVDGLNAEVSAEVEAGTYYLTVSGVGEGDGSGATPDNAGGYSDYGSLGNYTLSGEAAPFVVEDLVITSPKDGDDVTGGEPFEVTGTGEPGAVVKLTVGDEVVATVDVAEDGTWTAEVKANQYGNTEVSAAQTFDGIKAGTASVTVTAPVDAPVITSPKDDSTTEDTTPTIKGTGIPGATVRLAIVAPSGDVTTVEPKVAADGTWEYTPDTAWEAGSYGLAAAQQINGGVSETTTGIQFTIEVADTTDDSNTDGTTDDSSTDDSSTDDSSTDGTTDGTNTDGSSDDTDTTETDNTGTELAVTGAEIETAPIVMLAIGLLVVGAGTAAFAIRQRKLSAKE